MPKPKLSRDQKESLRKEIVSRLGKGDRLVEVVESLSKKYGVVGETIRWHVKKLQSGAAPKRRGRPPGSGTKRGRPSGSKNNGSVIELGVQRASLVLQIGSREVNVASLLYGNETQLVNDIRSAVLAVAAR